MEGQTIWSLSITGKYRTERENIYFSSHIRYYDSGFEDRSVVVTSRRHQFQL
jgi:hypothetical protein